MSGEIALHKLIATMQPVLDEREYVFATLTSAAQEQRPSVTVEQLAPLGTFQEPEGLTVIILKTQADTFKISYQGTFRCITLKVHSSLEAVGLTAAIATALTKQNISANVVAAYYHDHVFVPKDSAHEALACLVDLSLSYQ